MSERERDGWSVGQSNRHPQDFSSNCLRRVFRLPVCSVPGASAHAQVIFDCPTTKVRSVGTANPPGTATGFLRLLGIHNVVTRHLSIYSRSGCHDEMAVGNSVGFGRVCKVVVLFVGAMTACANSQHPHMHDHHHPCPGTEYFAFSIVEEKANSLPNVPQ